MAARVLSLWSAQSEASSGSRRKLLRAVLRLQIARSVITFQRWANALAVKQAEAVTSTKLVAAIQKRKWAVLRLMLGMWNHLAVHERQGRIQAGIAEAARRHELRARLWHWRATTTTLHAHELSVQLQHLDLESASRGDVIVELRKQISALQASCRVWRQQYDDERLQTSELELWKQQSTEHEQNEVVRWHQRMEVLERKAHLMRKVQKTLDAQSSALTKTMTKIYVSDIQSRREAARDAKHGPNARECMTPQKRSAFRPPGTPTQKSPFRAAPRSAQ